MVACQQEFTVHFYWYCILVLEQYVPLVQYAFVHRIMNPSEKGLQERHSIFLEDGSGFQSGPTI